MQLELRIRGIKEDVTWFIDVMKTSIPENVVSVSGLYPQTRYDKDSKEVAAYVKILNKE